MYRILSITNRKICKNDFLYQIEKISMAKPYGIVLREKDLSESEYEELAIKVLNICNEYKVMCILHTYVDVALRLKHPNVHLPLHILKEQIIRNPQLLENFKVVGISTHSVEEALEAKKLGATYITAGHIFKTDCKKGLEPRGLDYLRLTCSCVNIPVYAIGGINSRNIKVTKIAGASGACIMSGLMTVQSPKEELKELTCNI